MSVQIEAFRPMLKNTLLGFADVILPVTRLVIRDVAVHQIGDRCWINLPSRPLLNKDGSPMLNDRGKPLYSRSCGSPTKRHICNSSGR